MAALMQPCAGGICVKGMISMILIGALALTLSGCHAAPGYERLRVKGLKPETDYRVTSLAQAIRVGQFGNLLKHVAPVNVNPNGALLRIADRHITLPGKPETLTASGAALAAGIMLSPLFRGTGYAPEQRTQGDFGSDVYLIEEIGGE